MSDNHIELPTFETHGGAYALALFYFIFIIFIFISNFLHFSCFLYTCWREFDLTAIEVVKREMRTEE